VPPAPPVTVDIDLQALQHGWDSLAGTGPTVKVAHQVGVVTQGHNVNVQKVPQRPGGELGTVPQQWRSIGHMPDGILGDVGPCSEQGCGPIRSTGHSTRLVSDLLPRQASSAAVLKWLARPAQACGAGLRLERRVGRQGWNIDHDRIWI